MAEVLRKKDTSGFMLLERLLLIEALLILAVGNITKHNMNSR
jgi:competence protein ComGC